MATRDGRLSDTPAHDLGAEIEGGVQDGEICPAEAGAGVRLSFHTELLVVPTAGLQGATRRVAGAGLQPLPTAPLTGLAWWNHTTTQQKRDEREQEENTLVCNMMHCKKGSFEVTLSKGLQPAGVPALRALDRTGAAWVK